MDISAEIQSRLKSTKLSPEYSFAEKKRGETNYASHGYHHYPAKFIPQIVGALLEKYSNEKDLVLDPFGGCGTTLIEAKIMGRKSIGVDINKVAVLITRAKKEAIEPALLEKKTKKILRLFKSGKFLTGDLPNNDRIDYWFHHNNKRKLSRLISIINQIEDKKLQRFFLCGFSNILKNCSRWLQKSNKPVKCRKKMPAEPIEAFEKQIRSMLKGNEIFYELLKREKNMSLRCCIYPSDAKRINQVKDHSTDVIITSPPYVISYEYSDLHQLTNIWIDSLPCWKSKRANFIGTNLNKDSEINLNSKIAQGVVDGLREAGDEKIARTVGTYFSEMNAVFTEMKRCLKKDKHACIVIGNTRLRGVDILNAEVFTEQMCDQGFEIEDIIKREILSKNLPSTRDEETGRFVATDNNKKMLAYPTEYILVMKKRRN